MRGWAVFQANRGELVRATVESSPPYLAITEDGAVQEWEKFTLHDEGDKKVSFTATNGKVLCAEFGGGTLILANRGAVGGAWEKFTQTPNSDGTVSFTAANGKLVRAVGGGGDVLVCDGRQTGSEAKFTITALADGHVTLSTSAGNRVAVERTGGRVVANRDAIRDSQTFAVSGSGGTVSLKASNGKYVCDDRNRGNLVVADRDSAGEWERFTLAHPSGTTSTLRASSSRYVCADYGKGGKLYADRVFTDPNNVGIWETFTDVPGWERPRPKKLLIYYGWPSSINGAATIDAAAAEYACYDYVVLGRRVEESVFPGRADVIKIISRVAELSRGATRIFGYVPLGRAKKDEKLSDDKTPDRKLDERYTIAQLTERVNRWRDLAVSGVLLDEFGFDLGNDRQRQNDAVDAVHNAGLDVIANGWEPDDVFGTSGVDTKLLASDFYLCESWQLKMDEPDGYAKGADWSAKADKVRSYQQARQFRVLSVTTTKSAGFTASDLEYAWWSALLYGHEAFGWGEATFSAAAPMENSAPLRARPAKCPQRFSAGGVSASGTRHTRATDAGTAWVDTSTHTGGVS